jgi:hypothetical protein
MKMDTKFEVGDLVQYIGSREWGYPHQKMSQLFIIKVIDDRARHSWLSAISDSRTKGASLDNIKLISKGIK